MEMVLGTSGFQGSLIGKWYDCDVSLQQTEKSETS